MAKGVKIGKVDRKPGTLVYVDKSGNVMETKPNRGRKSSATKKKAAPKKAATKKKAAPKKKSAAKKPAAKRKTTAKKR